MKKALLALVAIVILGIGVYFFLRGKEPEIIPQPVPVVQSTSTKAIIGSSVEKRDIEAYTFGTGARHVLFVGGIHGGYEWNSVLLAYQFIDYIQANPGFVPEDVTVSIIPSANPDGVFKVLGKEGRFALADIPTTAMPVGTGRFNAHNVDLNRNFACKWKPESTWRNNKVSAGTAAFSEPEAAALRDYVSLFKPEVAVFWHSQANAVYASECEKGILPNTRVAMNAYAKAAGYPAVDVFDSYEVTGDAEGWLASIGIPAITVELKTHETTEWEKNVAGVKALFTSVHSFGK